MNDAEHGGLTRGSSHFRELTRAECEERLQEHVVGRVGFCGAAGPLILPVNYRVHTGQVVFRTSAYGMLAELRRRTPVAFEIDGIDEPAETGWDVLGRGTARSSYARPSPQRAVGQRSDPMGQGHPQPVHRHHLDLAHRSGRSRALRRLTDLAPSRLAVRVGAWRLNQDRRGSRKQRDRR